MTIRKPARWRPPERIQRDPTLWEDLRAIGRSVPKEELDRLPRDGAGDPDYYIYGTSKKDP